MFSSDAPMEQAPESFDFYESTGYLEGVLNQLGSGSTNVVNTNNTLKRAWTSCGSESDFAAALASFQEEKKVDVSELEQELSGRTKRENISPDKVRGGDNSFLNENGGGYHFNQQDVEPGNMVGLAVPPDPLRLVIVDPPGPIGLGLGMIPHGPIEFNPSDNNYFSVVSTSVAPPEPVEVNPNNNNNNNYFHVVGTSVAPAEPVEVNAGDNNNYFNVVGSSVASEVGGHQNQGNGNRAEVNFVLEKRHKRMIKNRESAARSRARKQAYATELELEVEELKRENARLMREKFYDEMIAKPPVKPSPLLRRTYSAHAKYLNWNQADIQ